MSAALSVGGKEPDLDDENTEIDLNRLPAKDREAVFSRVTPDDSSPPDAYALAQNEIRREVRDFNFLAVKVVENNNGLPLVS